MYKTRLNLVEPTKLLERVTVDNMRFLNPIGHDYVGGVYNISPKLNIDDGNYMFAVFLGDQNTTAPIPPTTNLSTESYFNLYAIDKPFKILNLCYWYLRGNDAYLTDVKMVDPNGKEVFSGQTQATNGEVLASVKLDTVGTYTLTYKAYGALIEDSATYSFYALNNATAKTPYTITDVINRILNAGVGAWNGYYKLDPVLAEKWSKIPAPEFEITGKTLFEALLMVGGYKDIQAIPRLGPTPNSAEDWEYNFITFDLLNETTEWKPKRGCIDRQIIYNGESYCGGLESYVDNFVDSSKNGAVRVPYPMTVRTENTDLVIDDNYAIIKTEFPIYKVNKVKQYRINQSGGDVGDITPYIFEKSEYDNLSSYTGDFPKAKQFALYYVQGQPNIYGLVLKPEVANALGLASKKGQFAAVQIANKRSGQNYDSSEGVSAFAYSVEYTPITSRRLRQYRPTSDYPNGNLLYYNQSSNIVDSKNYGGRMKNELARVGNKVILETYRVFKLADLPKAGQTKDGKRITQVDWEMQLTSIKATIYLVENYNRISEYVGINSLQRFYEVSEKQATARLCNFSYMAKVGQQHISSGELIMTGDCISAFSNVFGNISAENVGNYEITFVVATAYAKDGTLIQSPTVHAVSSNGFGNSISFFFSFEDNYSAGGQAVQASQDGTVRQVQVAVPYGDEYGEFYYLKMDFYNYDTIRNNEKYPNGFTWNDQIENGWCKSLPKVQEGDFQGEPYMSYTATIDKNSGEKISVETQLHFQAEDSDVIIGSALGEDNPLVSNVAHTHTFVLLPYALEPLQESIPVEDIEKCRAKRGVLISSGNSYVSISRLQNDTEQDAKSWACVNEEGNILIGRNEEVAVGAEISETIYINFYLNKPNY